MQPSNDNLQQAEIRLALRIPEYSNVPKFYAEVRQLLLASFKKDQNFQMTVQGLGTQTWLLQGRERLKQEVHLRNLRKRVRKILSRDSHFDC